MGCSLASRARRLPRPAFESPGEGGELGEAREVIDIAQRLGGIDDVTRGKLKSDLIEEEGDDPRLSRATSHPEVARNRANKFGLMPRLTIYF